MEEGEREWQSTSVEKKAKRAMPTPTNAAVVPTAAISMIG